MHRIYKLLLFSYIYYSMALASSWEQPLCEELLNQANNLPQFIHDYKGIGFTHLGGRPRLVGYEFETGLYDSFGNEAAVGKSLEGFKKSLTESFPNIPHSWTSGFYASSDPSGGLEIQTWPFDPELNLKDYIDAVFQNLDKLGAISHRAEEDEALPEIVDYYFPSLRRLYSLLEIEVFQTRSINVNIEFYTEELVLLRHLVYAHELIRAKIIERYQPSKNRSFFYGPMTGLTGKILDIPGSDQNIIKYHIDLKTKYQQVLGAIKSNEDAGLQYKELLGLVCEIKYRDINYCPYLRYYWGSFPEGLSVGTPRPAIEFNLLDARYSESGKKELKEYTLLIYALIGWLRSKELY